MTENLAAACERSGGTFTSAGFCDCPPGFRSSWDADVTGIFCSESDPIGEYVPPIDEDNSRLFDRLISCNSPIESIFAVVVVLCITSFAILFIVALYGCHLRRREH